MAALSAPAVPSGVLIVLAGSDVAKVSDLDNKTVLMTKLNSISPAEVSAALRVSGASDARLEEGGEDAIVKLIEGQASAAIVAFVTPEKASSFSEASGFRILRINVGAGANRNAAVVR